MRITLPPLGFGGAPLGNMFQPLDEATADATLKAAWEAGIRYYDTSPHYGAGLAEQRFGRLLSHKPRNEFVLSTKVGRLLRPASAPENAKPFVDELPNKRVVDYSADGARRSIEDSLERMGVDRIDVAFIHDVSEDQWGAQWTEYFQQAMNGAAKALTHMREEGLIRGWGLGVNLVEPCRLALEQSDPDVFLLAGRYSLLDHRESLDTLFPQCVERGVGIVVGGPSTPACWPVASTTITPTRLTRSARGRRPSRPYAASSAWISVPRRCSSAWPTPRCCPPSPAPATRGARRSTCSRPKPKYRPRSGGH